MFAGPSLKLFRVLGFQVGAHWTLPLALVLAAVSHGGIGGVLLSVLLFASILAHELGHAVIARRRNVPIAGIDLHMFGGTALMSAPPQSPNDEIAIAVAGPIVSFALGAAALVAHAFLLPSSSVLFWLGSANVMLGAFNLVPALPMDGGRVLRALLAKRRGLVDGTRWAVRVARVFSVLLAAAGLWTSSWMLVALAVVVWMMGTSELRSVTRHEVLTQMGAWHPRHVPWARYDRASRSTSNVSNAANASNVAKAAGTVIEARVIEPDSVWPT